MNIKTRSANDIGHAAEWLIMIK